MYNVGILASKSYNFPVVCVGNLSTGGTGKSPMIEYLIRLLKDDSQIATLSRGYKRSTKGFVLANEQANAATIGDEPFQFYNKFETIQVAVDENRQHGIKKLRQLNPKPKVVLLDDAYQHRKVKAGLNILLTAYGKLYCNDWVLPTGNLREPRSGANRAQIIVVTKCPKYISKEEKRRVRLKLKPKPHQHLFFSTISYSEAVIGSVDNLPLNSLQDFTLVTGIANAQPLVDFLKSKNLNFEHLKYADHYNYTKKDMALFASKKTLITTEKDYMRLAQNTALKNKLYYLPINITIDKPEDFNNLITNFCVIT